MFKVGNIVKMERGARFPKNIVNRMSFSNDNIYKILEIFPDLNKVIAESVITGNTYEININFLDIVNNSFSEKSLNSTLEELYEMILKENCSEDLKSKFWDLHKVLASKEKEVKIRLEEINKLIWE